ncbi:MAG: hypothetical protein WBC70_08690 [Candidatus Aminicenantales bacterium]
MRKWLFILLVLAVLYALSKFTGKKQQARYPFLKRVDRTINLLVWVLLTAYLVSFFYWLYTEIIR